jgi:hypothetical protein
LVITKKVPWKQWSPNWRFDDATFERTAAAYDNPDYVDVVIHSYRHRYGLAPGDLQYADLERRLAALPAIPVPAITLDGESDGVTPANDGKWSAEVYWPAQTPRSAERWSQSSAGGAGCVRGRGHGIAQVVTFF